MVKSLGLDRLFQGQAVSNHLTDEGLPVVEIGQGYMSMGPLMKEFERRWLARRVHHGADVRGSVRAIGTRGRAVRALPGL